MGYQKIKRPVLASRGVRKMPVESHGSTDSTLDAYGLSIITATATGLTYTMAAPVAGVEKFVGIDYNGATGNLTIAQAATGVNLNGSTANIITVSSSESHLLLHFVGASTSNQWLLTSTGSGVTFTA